jgi:4-hydroxybenzoate polyprenyltransferase
LRPILFFPGWSTMLAGFFIAYRNTLVRPFLEINAQDFRLILFLMILFAAAMGGCFLLNQLQDIESDRRNKKLFIIAEGHINRRAAVIEIIVLIILSLSLAFYVSADVGLLAAIFILITGYVYNFKPFRLKNRPWGSLFANGLMGWLAFSIGWASRQPMGVRLIFDSLPYLFFNTALYLFTTLPDREGDMQSGKRTLAVAYGIKFIVYTAFLLYLGSMVCGFIVYDKLALFFILLSLPFFLLTLKEQNTESTMRATKFAILFFALAVCLKWPYYFIFMITTFFITRWYFKMRFTFDYPNFRPS